LIARPRRNHGLKVSRSRAAETPAATIVSIGHHDAWTRNDHGDDEEYGGDRGEAQREGADVVEGG